MNTRFANSLLLLTGLALGLVVRPMLSPKPAGAQTSGAMAVTAVTKNLSNTHLSVSAQGVAYVVSDGMITAYEVRDHKLARVGTTCISTIPVNCRPPKIESSVDGLP